MKYDAVFLLAFGGPNRIEDVKPFLENVTRGHNIPPERIETVLEQYRAIGGASPLNEITYKQARSLQKFLEQSGNPSKIYVGMRNWPPLIRDTLAQMKKDGIKNALGIILSAYQCEASWGRYVQAVQGAAKFLGENAPAIHYSNPWNENPLWTEAIIDRIGECLTARPELKGEDCHWIFTAHSIPVNMNEQSNYSKDFYHTAQLTSEKFKKKEWSTAYQSRSGSPRDPWLEPDIGDKLKELRSRGIRRVLAIPIGFVSDHVEVLYDLDIKAKKIAEELSLEFFRAKTVNDHPKFIELLAELCLKK